MTKDERSYRDRLRKAAAGRDPKELRRRLEEAEQVAGENARLRAALEVLHFHPDKVIEVTSGALIRVA
jgi:hypothetical protein